MTIMLPTFCEANTMRMLVISSGHVPEQTRKALADRDDALDTLMWCDWYDFGWIIFVPEEATLPPEHVALQILLRMARAASMDYLRLDCDGPIVTELAWFDAEEGS